MEQVSNNNVYRAPVETRAPGVPNSADSAANFGTVRPQPPPLIRTDSRSSFPTPSARPPGPQLQQRPQFQPGGPVNAGPQFAQRPGSLANRAPIPNLPGTQQGRIQSPTLRPGGPQSIAPQQGPRYQQVPPQGSPRPPLPNNLQFGPRQPPQFGGAVTPDGSRQNINSQLNDNFKQGVAPAPNQQVTRPPSQTSLNNPDLSNSYPNKSANLDNSNVSNENQNINKMPDVNNEVPGTGKGRSFSISAAPGVPNPIRAEEDRRKSVSAVSGRYEDISGRGSGLGQIQEMRDSKDNIRGSKESVRSEVSNDGQREAENRPDSRLSGSKMTESFMGSLSNLGIKKKTDDDDDVVLQNSLAPTKNDPNKPDLSDRSPSLTRSDESPEPKNTSQNSTNQKSKSATPEPRPKTPKSDIKPDTMPDTKPELKKTPSPSTPNKPIAKSPLQDLSQSPAPEIKSPNPPKKKPNDLYTSPTPIDSKKSTPRKVASAPKSRPKDGDNDSGVDETTQGNDINGSPQSPSKRLPSKLPTKEKSSCSLKPSLSRSSSKSATAKTPENPPPVEKKKVPMNKVQVGNAPSPNIKAVKSKIGSLENSTYKPGGGKVKIENRKLDFNNITPKIAAKNDAYTPSGGVKKITTTKLEWNAKSKVGSLQNTSYKPGGGDKKIETVKLDFKDKAKPKVASTVNISHKPGGGTVKNSVTKSGGSEFVKWALPRWRTSSKPSNFVVVRNKIENQKLEFKAQSKVGSLDNVKHKPGGGDIKIYDDKDYIKQIGGPSPLPNSQGHSRQEDEYYVEEWEEDQPLTRSRSARFARTPRTPRALSPRKIPEDRFFRDKNWRSSQRPISARDPARSACSRRSSITQRPAFTVY